MTNPYFSFSRRLLIFFGFFAYFLVTYLSIQFIAAHYLTPVDLALPGEEHIPFLPPVFLIYLSAYAFPIFIVFFVEEREAYLKAVKAYFIASLIHYAFFLLLPVRYLLRPDLGAPQSLLLQAIALFYRADEPLNSFPSIHVSYAFLTYFCLNRVGSPYARAAFVWATAIAISTVFVKQHYLLDIIAAILLATGINYFYLIPSISSKSSK